MSDEQWRTIVVDRARRAVRPMVLALARRGVLDARALDAIEVELRRQMPIVSDGTLKLVSMEKSRVAAAGLIRFTVEPTGKARSGP